MIVANEKTIQEFDAFVARRTPSVIVANTAFCADRQNQRARYESIQQIRREFFAMRQVYQVPAPKAHFQRVIHRTVTVLV